MSSLLEQKDDIINAVIETITADNTAMAESSHDLGSIEALKVFASTSFAEDILLISSLNGNKSFKMRHVNAIMRGLLEQVIEFAYIIKHPELKDQYLGLHKEPSSNDDKPVKTLLQLGGKRFKDGRKTIGEMAKDIGEKGPSDGDELTLYTIYTILSNEIHNSYYGSILDRVSEVEGDEEVPLTELQMIYLVHIIDTFMDAYQQ